MVVSADEVIASALERIDRDEATIYAWASLAEPGTVPMSPSDGSGLLAGVGFGIKDIIDTADLPTERGSVLFAGRRPSLDATVVSLLRAHGAVVVGKTVTTVFGMRDPGPTRNPHDSKRTPGGSSSGSAAAVAAGHVDLAIGTQTGGSVIRPAAYCGVWGIKPTAGVIDRFGLMLHSSSVDTIGFIGRDPEILARALVAVTRPEGPMRAAQGSTSVLGPVTPMPLLRFMRSRRDEVLEPLAREAIDDWLDAIRKRGDIQVELVDPPLDDVALDDVLRLVVNYEAARLLDGLVAEHGAAVGDHVLHLVEDGRTISATAYRDALAGVAAARARIDAWLADGFVVAPSARGVAPLGLGSTGSAEYCRPWSLLGNPTVNVPGLRADAAMPLGVQVVTARHTDLWALRAAAQVGRLTADPTARLH